MADTLNRNFYNFILSKINDPAINSEANSVPFKGNFSFAFVGDQLTVFSTSQTNAYDLTETNFIAMSESVDTEVPYVEDVDRSEWIKQYDFMIRVGDTNKALVAMNNLKAFFDSNSAQDIVVNGITYRFGFKTSRPKFVTSFFGHAGANWVLYRIQFGASSLDTAKALLCNDVVIKIGTPTLETAAFDKFVVRSGVAMNPSNKITDAANVENEPISRSTSGNADMYYKPTNALHRTILKLINGTEDRTTEIKLQTTIDTIVTDYTAYINGGTFTIKKGLPLILSFTWVEKT